MFFCLIYLFVFPNLHFNEINTKTNYRKVRRSHLSLLSIAIVMLYICNAGNSRMSQIRFTLLPAQLLDLSSISFFPFSISITRTWLQRLKRNNNNNTKIKNIKSWLGTISHPNRRVDTPSARFFLGTLWLTCNSAFIRKLVSLFRHNTHAIITAIQLLLKVNR